MRESKVDVAEHAGERDCAEVDAIAKAHGGACRVGANGHGTTFSLELPQPWPTRTLTATPEAAAQLAPAPPTAEAEPARAT